MAAGCRLVCVRFRLVCERGNCFISGGALWLCLHSLFWSEGLWGVSAAGVGSWLLVRDAGSRVYVQVEGGYLLYGLGLAAEVWAFCLSIVTVGCGL